VITVLIKAITTIAGPGLVVTSGQEAEVDDKLALLLINGGYAVPVKSAVIETAMIEQKETAVIPRATKRGKK
jgi:hypothetical protein